MKVEDVMTRALFTCRPHTMLDEVSRMMWEGDIGALPVVDDHGRPIAMITDRDACMATYTQGARLSDIPVRIAMSKTLYTCHPQDQLSAAERTMRVHQVRRLPVIDDVGALVGLLSLADIALARVRAPRTAAAERLKRDVAETLAAICHRATPAPPPARSPEDGWNSFEIHDAPDFPEAAPSAPHGRIPPPGFASAPSRLWT